MKKSPFSTTITIIAVLTLANFLTGTKPVNAELSASEWQLTVTGLVEHTLNLFMTELQNLPQTTVNATLYCVDKPSYAVAQGSWAGVKLWYLLEEAGVSPHAVKVAFVADDGYKTDLTLETAKRADVIVAYQKDGLPLSEKLRLVVPGKWGYKWIAMLTRIELVNFDFKGTWESQGYTDSADITEGSRKPNPIPSFLRPRNVAPTSPNQSSAPNSLTPNATELPTTPSQSPSVITDEKAFRVSNGLACSGAFSFGCDHCSAV
ncbi:molybdopterin-dependent oxidoreductase [Candidatus Bathyarchaeota archaeon A05DMB-2]|nr:molybdopterin-dependent oxidoreductase [Candidatus Bathyarchaeota archaeon A05DMB-2]